MRSTAARNSSGIVHSTQTELNWSTQLHQASIGQAQSPASRRIDLLRADRCNIVIRMLFTEIY